MRGKAHQSCHPPAGIFRTSALQLCRNETRRPSGAPRHEPTHMRRGRIVPACCRESGGAPRAKSVCGGLAPLEDRRANSPAWLVSDDSSKPDLPSRICQAGFALVERDAARPPRSRIGRSRMARIRPAAEPLIRSAIRRAWARRARPARLPSRRWPSPPVPRRNSPTCAQASCGTRP